MPEIDVIAQWNADGTIEPRRIRVHSDGESYSYTLQSATAVSHSAGNVHGKYVTESTFVWECAFLDSGVRKVVYLFFDGRKWDLTT